MAFNMLESFDTSEVLFLRPTTLRILKEVHFWVAMGVLFVLCLGHFVKCSIGAILTCSLFKSGSMS